MTRSGPAGPSRSAPTWDGEGTNFSLFSENAERVELCLFDDDGRRDARRADRAHRVQLARLPARRRPRPALRLPRPRALRARAGAPLQPEQAADRPVREGDRGPGPLGRAPTCSRTSPGRATTPTSSCDDEDDAAAIPKSRRHRPALRLGGRPAAAARRWHETVIYETHVKGFTKRHPGRARGPARHLRRPRVRGGDRVPRASSASPRSSCCRSTTSPTRRSSPSAG